MYDVGDTVKDFTLESTSGTYTLSERTSNGYALLYFYVVNFGRTCTDYMEVMNERMPDLKERNVELVHINPEPIDNHRDWIRSTASLFEHLSDKGQLISREFDCIITKAKNEAFIGKTNRAFFLIDENLVIRYCWRADMPGDTIPMNELLAHIDTAIVYHKGE